MRVCAVSASSPRGSFFFSQPPTLDRPAGDGRLDVACGARETRGQRRPSFCWSKKRSHQRKMPKERPEPARRKRVSSERRQKTNRKTKQNMQTAPKRKRHQKVVSSKEEEKLSNTYIVYGSCSVAAETSQNQKVITVTSAQRAKWQLLPKSESELLESMIHWLIVSILYETTEQYSETEKHLNLLKKRLQTCLKTLRVPVEKLGSLNNVHKILAQERKRSIDIEGGLTHLQKEIMKMLPAAELRKQNIEQLQERVQNLKCELAAEEAAAKELFQKNGDELGLPDISKYCQKAPILQDEILKIRNQESLLNYLHTFQQSEEVQAMSTFIEKAHDFMEQRN